MIGSLRPAPTFDVGSGRGVTVKRKGLGPNAEHWRVRWRRDCGPEPAQPSPCQHMQVLAAPDGSVLVAGPT